MQLREDARYALRQFANAPGFTATAVLTLALGIGATTAIFTLVHAVLLKSLPVAKPSELVRIGDREDCCVSGGLRDDWSLFSYDKYKTFRDGTPGFVELAGFPGGERPGRRAPHREQSARRVSTKRVRFWKLLLHVWHRPLRGARAYAPGRSQGSGSSRSHELSHLATEVRSGPFCRRG